MGGLLRSLLLGSMLAVSANAAIAAERAIIVLDGSGSMWGQIDAKPKLEIARETLRTVLRTVPGETELGLMAYGHRQKGVCSDIELVVEPAAGTGTAIADAADKMRFIGMTPLSEAVKQAAESLRYTEEKATVILITDGIETCNADPCALANELEQSGIEFTAHVVGFGLSEEEGKKVACLAENTGGKFIQAKDAGSLSDALTQTVAVAPEPEPEPAKEEPAFEHNFVPTVALAEDTEDLTQGQTWEIYKARSDGSPGERVKTEYNEWKGNLEPGDYIVSVSYGRATTTQPITINPDEYNNSHFILNAGTVIIRPRESEGGEVARSATLRFKHAQGDTTEYGETKVVLPAGEIQLEVEIGEGTASETFVLKAGYTVEKDVVVGVGRAALKASYVPGMEIDRGPTFRIQKAAKKIDGTRETVRTEYNMAEVVLMPGEYYADVDFQGAVGGGEFTVKVGERTEVDVVLNAGVLAIAAPEAEKILVLEAKKDLQGNREQVGFAYKAEYQVTLNEGDYVVVAEYPGDKAATEKPVSVRAGERTEITVP